MTPPTKEAFLLTKAEIELILEMRRFPIELGMCTELGIRCFWAKQGPALPNAFLAYGRERGEP